MMKLNHRLMVALPLVAGLVAVGAPAAQAQHFRGGYGGYRGGYGYHGGYGYRGGYGYHRGYGGALVGGLIGGTILGLGVATVLAPPPVVYAPPAYYAPPPPVVYAPPQGYAQPGYYQPY